MVPRKTGDLKMYANKMGYTDIHPYEIVRKVSEKTLEIRAMDTVLDPAWKMVAHVGGFCANVVNNGGEWIITSNPENTVIRVRLGKKGYKNKYGERFVLSSEPEKFYDYNF
jgi:hypothetical protein